MVHLQVNGSLPYILSSYNNITSACRIDVDRFSIDAWLSCIIPESAKVNNLWSSIASDYKYHLDGGSIDTYNISAMFDMVQKTNFNYFYTNKCCVPSNSWTISGGMLHEVKSNDKFPSDTICSGSGTLSVLNGYYSARYAGICARNRSSSSGSVFG